MLLLTTAVCYIILTLAHGTSNTELKERIIGGSVVGISSYPYMVSLHSHRSHICGGSIIAPDTILTAAHCIAKGQPSQYTIHSGSDSADLGTVHQVYQIIIHDNYNLNDPSSSYDVAKLKINPPITYSTNSQPVRLSSRRVADNTMLVIAGWGRQKEGVKATAAEKQNLRAVYLRAVNQEECVRRNGNKITSVIMCAAASGVDSCQGDSGGPLVNAATGEQVGIASWGFGCANANYPGAYASVPELLNFIRS